MPCAGDVARLGILFERYHRPLFDFLARMTGDRAAAEDLVQDVFIRILKYRATFRDEGSFETWIFRIARNARADWFNARRTDTAGPRPPTTRRRRSRPTNGWRARPRSRASSAPCCCFATTSAS